MHRRFADRIKKGDIALAFQRCVDLRIALVENAHCTICKRLLDNPADPSADKCGGDCWGCIGAIEVEIGCEESLTYECKKEGSGLRLGWIDPLRLDLEAALRPLLAQSV